MRVGFAGSLPFRNKEDVSMNPTNFNVANYSLSYLGNLKGAKHYMGAEISPPKPDEEHVITSYSIHYTKLYERPKGTTPPIPTSAAPMVTRVFCSMVKSSFL